MKPSVIYPFLSVYTKVYFGYQLLGIKLMQTSQFKRILINNNGQSI